MQCHAKFDIVLGLKLQAAPHTVFRRPWRTIEEGMLARLGARAPPGPVNGSLNASLILPAYRRPSMAGSSLPQRDGSRGKFRRAQSQVRAVCIVTCRKDASLLVTGVLRTFRFVFDFSVAVMMGPTVCRCLTAKLYKIMSRISRKQKKPW